MGGGWDGDDSKIDMMVRMANWVFCHWMRASCNCSVRPSTWEAQKGKEIIVRRVCESCVLDVPVESEWGGHERGRPAARRTRIAASQREGGGRVLVYARPACQPSL